MILPGEEHLQGYAAVGYEYVIQELENVPASSVLANGTTDVRLVRCGERSFIVRKPGNYIDGANPHELLQHRAIALRRGIGVRALEQMVAYSPERETIVTEYVDLPTLDALPTTTVEQIERHHYAALLDTIEEMCSRDIRPDTGHADNCLFGPEGFVLLDYFPLNPEEPWSHHNVPTTFLLFLAMTIDEVVLSHDRYYKQAWLRAFNTGLDVLEQRYPGALNTMVPGLNWLKRIILSASEQLGSSPTSYPQK